MAMFLECDPRILTINEEKSPDRETEYIYEHLKYCLSKTQLLPAAIITLDCGLPVVTRGHKYVRIAVELGRPSIPAIIVGEVPNDDVQRFLAQEGVRIVDPETIRREEEELSVADGEHVFFFEKPLSVQQKRAFEEEFVGFFTRLDSVLLRNRPRSIPKARFSHEGYCAECFATTPAGDESW